MVLDHLGAEPAQEAQVTSQVYADDRGLTDLELVVSSSLHAIFEAKLGWRVPNKEQLERYVPRLHKSPAKQKVMVSISAASRSWACNHLPEVLDGISVVHMAWSDLQELAMKAHDATRSPIERLWLWQLSEHLKGYGMTSYAFDSRAYVVVLNQEPIKPGNPLTWIDVVTQQHRYFHPVGGGGVRWPKLPPAYLGFRYKSEFRSVHHVESVITTDHLQEIDPQWPDTNTPHFVYTLGPAMRPTSPMPLGKIHPSMHARVALDLLLSGVASDFKHAMDLMKKRTISSGNSVVDLTE